LYPPEKLLALKSSLLASLDDADQRATCLNADQYHCMHVYADELTGTQELA
jgi:hypothetical protein